LIIVSGSWKVRFVNVADIVNKAFWFSAAMLQKRQLLEPDKAASLPDLRLFI
jgi:hypothetical protein